MPDAVGRPMAEQARFHADYVLDLIVDQVADDLAAGRHDNAERGLRAATELITRRGEFIARIAGYEP